MLRNCFEHLLLALLGACALCVLPQAHAQQVITTNGYTQDFDSIGSGLPANWTVRAGTISNSLGTVQSLTTTPTAWNNSTGAFKNMSSTNIASNSTALAQTNNVNRALGVKTTAAFGDTNPANRVSFNFHFSTVDVDLTSISIDLLSLDTGAGREQIWTLQYAIGSSPTTFVTLDTYTASSTFGGTTFVFDLTTNPADFAAMSGQTDVWFRVAGLTATTGSGNRPATGIDNFVITATGGGPPPVGDDLYWTANGTTLGGSGTWNNAGANWSPTASPVDPATWDGEKKAIFAGDTAGTVTVETVTAEAGLQFSTTGYTLTGGTLTLGAATRASNTITTDSSVRATIATSLAGDEGMTKAGSGTLSLSGNNSGLTGGIDVAAGTLEVASSNALGDNDVSLANGTTLTSDATDRTIDNTLIIAGDVGLGVDGSGDLELTSVDFAGGTRTLTVGNDVLVTLSGTYGNGGLNMAGAGGSLSIEESGTLTELGISSGSMTIEEGVTVTTTAAQLTSSGGTLYIDGTLRNTSTVASSTIGGNIVVGSTGTVIQEGNGSATNLLFGGSGVRTWEEGSTFIFRNFTLTPAVSNRTYEMNLVFESTGGTMNVGAISGAGAWSVLGDLTIGEDVNFNFGVYSGALTYAGNVTVGGTLGSVNGVRSFTLNEGKELLLQNSGTVNIADGQTVSVEGSIRTTATGDQQATISGGEVSLDADTVEVNVSEGDGNAGLVISSQVVSDGGLDKTGSGSLRLTGNNTFSGSTTVSAGTLELAGEDGNAAAGGTSAITVASDATLLIASSNQVNDSATITLSGEILRAPGVSEVFGDLNLAGAATLNYGGFAEESFLQFGTLTLNDNTLTVANFFLGNQLSYTAADFADGMALAATFDFVNSYSDLGYSFGGGTFTITAIPEPSTYAAALGLLGLMMWPSRKRIIRRASSVLGLRRPMRDRLAARDVA